MTSRDLDGTYREIILDNIEREKYYINLAGDIFDNEDILFIDEHEEEYVIKLIDKHGNFVYYNKMELILKTFVPSIYTDIEELGGI